MKSYLIIGVLLTVACSNQPTEVYQTTSKDKWKTTSIEIHWMSKTDVNNKCIQLGTVDGPSASYAACARSKPDNESICEVYTTRPANFDDAVALETLGHEIWHCLGATHN